MLGLPIQFALNTDNVKDVQQMSLLIKKKTDKNISVAQLHTYKTIYRCYFDALDGRKLPDLPQQISKLEYIDKINFKQSYVIIALHINPSFEDIQSLNSFSVNDEMKQFLEKHIPDILEPQKLFPHDQVSQMHYMIDNWDLKQELKQELLLSIDLLKEENKPHFTGPGKAYVLNADDDGEEAFTIDKNWMPTVILQAKNTIVWLDQLSRKYNKLINKLQDIPDEELDEMKDQGFNALWLIGIWNRSYASRRIKQIRGNDDAVASAYALKDYRISDRVGGQEGYLNIRDRLISRGIRLAADMVPNHMAIDSNWVIEHPEWFIHTKNSHYPYSFTGEDLCQHPEVSIHIEDKYFSEEDAAVVFKRYDHRTGETIYIYHGNDGTAIPWNDTAQLNFLKAEVREKIIDTIIDLAKKFPILRFDAAMVLVKKHIRRLWWPEQGKGGAIASRSLYAMKDEEFNKLIPKEFWRDVVERINKEVPDTLLIAEAFWMLESYFVRTLGMHRVYNSAFMHMLRDEENKKYRRSIKNILDFNPQILKRFVNFLTTPDEKTAIDQFGDGDKYFGICTLMVTLPGTPLFGHGQFNGFRERYGMEFQRAYLHEKVREDIKNRHLREITPLMKMRHLFSEVDNFVLYDFFNQGINEDVYAFSNGNEKEKALVVYNNRFERSSGWINIAFIPRGLKINRQSLFKALNLKHDSFIIFKDVIRNLEYIRTSTELLQGLYLELEGYQCHVFLDFRIVDKTYRKVWEELDGRGTDSIEKYKSEITIN